MLGILATSRPPAGGVQGYGESADRAKQGHLNAHLGENMPPEALIPGKLWNWSRARKACDRGLSYVAFKDLKEFWENCRRGDWLCWVLDWKMVQDMPAVFDAPHWQRAHWRIFLELLFRGSGIGLGDTLPMWHQRDYKAAWVKFKRWDDQLQLWESDVEMYEDDAWKNATGIIRSVYGTPEIDLELPVPRFPRVVPMEPQGISLTNETDHLGEELPARLGTDADRREPGSNA